MLPIEIRERLESISAITIHRLQFTLKVARKKINQKTQQYLVLLGFSSGPTWARTMDPLIMSQVL